MGLRAAATVGVEVERNDAQRLSADDMAAERAAELAADALHAHRVRQARRRAAMQDGRCGNCEAVLTPPLLYCDRDCRDDHEARERLLARTRHRTG